MNPQDDPEARIRDLERPLADVARTSELGAGQYSTGDTYMPPPLPAYGAPPPYPGAPTPRKSGGFPWWVLVVVAIIVFGAIGAGIFIFSEKMFTLGSGTRPPIEIPSVDGGGGNVDKGPSGQPSVPGGSITEAPSAELPIPPPGEQLSVSGVGKNETIACNDTIVSVSGVSNTVTITGHCARLTVSGMENQVIVDTADTITASGFDNVVIYHSGSPEISAHGDNVVQQG